MKPIEAAQDLATGLYVDPTPMVVLPVVTTATGEGLIQLPLTVAGDLILQWLHVAPGANPLGVLATEDQTVLYRRPHRR